MLLLNFAAQLNIENGLEIQHLNKAECIPILPCLKARQCLNFFKHAYLSCIEPAVKNGC
jgi:hypothetical protein